jgi:hypothetical protein
MPTWVITPLPDGRYELKVRGRPARTVEDEDEAWRYIRGQMEPEDRVQMTEKDGYRVPITRKVRRAK